jgi:hypothetical protein
MSRKLLTTFDFNAPITLSGSAGTSGQVLTSAGAGATPTWTTVSGGGGASLSTANTWTATQTFTPTTILSSAITLKQASIVSAVNNRFTSSGKGYANTYFAVTINASFVEGQVYNALFTGVAGFTNGFYTVTYTSGYFRYDVDAVGGATSGTITIYQQGNPFTLRNYNNTAEVAGIDTNGRATFAGGGIFGSSISVTGNITATGTIPATKLNMSSTTLTGVANGGYTTITLGSDYNIAANTWDSFDGTGWKVFSAYNNNFIINGAITVRTQSSSTSAKVTVKVMVVNYNYVNYTLIPVLSAEAIIPAISGVNGVATIPINGIMSIGAVSGANKYFVVEIYSTAAITVKATVPDNPTGNIIGPFSSSYANDPTASASYINLIGLK